MSVIKPIICFVLMFLAVTTQTNFAFSSPLCKKPNVETLQKMFSQPSEKNFLGYDADTLASRTYAVHVTQFLPKDGIIRAGDNPLSFRPEIHFALGEMVRSHVSGNWENMPYAIVTPLKTLEPQLINIMSYDTFILGDFKIPEDAVLVLPNGKNLVPPKGVRTVGYDPTKTTLRKAVDSIIEGQNGFHIQGTNGMGAYYHRAMLDGVNVNTPDFFKPILDRNPLATFGTHARGQSGKSYALGMLDLEYLTGTNIAASAKAAHFRNFMADHFVEEVDSLAHDSHFPQITRDTYARLESNFKSRVRRQYWGVRRVPDEGKPELLDFRYLQNQNPTTAQEIMNKFPDFFTDDLRKENLIAYGLARYPVVQNKIAENEGLLRLIDDAAKNELSKHGDQRGQIADPVLSIIRTYFVPNMMNSESGMIPDLCKLFELPHLQKLLAKRWEMNFPENAKLTMQDLLAAFPDTKSAYLAYPEIYSDKDAVRLLRSSGIFRDAKTNSARNGLAYRSPLNRIDSLRNGDFLKPPFSDIEEAEVAARMHEQNKGNFLMAASLNDPLLNTNSMNGKYSQTSIPQNLRNSGSEKLIEFWRGLGLEKQFKAAFPDDTVFWKSDKSLLQIYKNLNQNTN